MGILSRIRRNSPGTGDEWLRTGAVRWEPLAWGTAQTLNGPYADMGDPGQVLQKAYGVVFKTRAVQGARIAVCTYAAETQEAYWKGIRYTYDVKGDGRSFYTGWERDPEDWAYDGSSAADTAALGLAVLMARDPGWAAATLPGIFDWDGRRFDTADRDSDGAP